MYVQVVVKNLIQRAIIDIAILVEAHSDTQFYHHNECRNDAECSVVHESCCGALQVGD
jgi:hypothetical protein